MPCLNLLLATVMWTTQANPDDLIFDLMPTIIRTTIYSVGIIGTSTRWELLNDAKAHNEQQTRSLDKSKEDSEMEHKESVLFSRRWAHLIRQNPVAAYQNPSHATPASDPQDPRQRHLGQRSRSTQNNGLRRNEHPDAAELYIRDFPAALYIRLLAPDK
jgi:hypothetical protein